MKPSYRMIVAVLLLAAFFLGRLARMYWSAEKPNLHPVDRAGVLEQKLTPITDGESCGTALNQALAAFHLKWELEPQVGMTPEQAMTQAMPIATGEGCKFPVGRIVSDLNQQVVLAPVQVSITQESRGHTQLDVTANCQAGVITATFLRQQDQQWQVVQHGRQVQHHC